jgi:hypothetical protein
MSIKRFELGHSPIVMEFAGRPPGRPVPRHTAAGGFYDQRHPEARGIGERASSTKAGRAGPSDLRSPGAKRGVERGLQG